MTKPALKSAMERLMVTLTTAQTQIDAIIASHGGKVDSNDKEGLVYIRLGILDAKTFTGEFINRG